MSNHPFTVSELTQLIKGQLETQFSDVSLQGEVSNCKLQSSGHLYFSLKDSDAQISCVMFRLDTQSLKRTLKDGDHVHVLGSLNVYPPGGRYQIIIKTAQLIGLGELLIKLEQLKIKLHQKGYFRSDRKKAIPKLPKRIGVVTSPTGAVIQDILNVLTRRFSGFRLLLNPVKVQGEGAALEIAQAIQFFNQHQLVDVMIIGRGGGSIEDLWAFNEEIVADAIYKSQIPIISAVGHETDHCIADYVADMRAPTPSAAAEIVIAEKYALITHLNQLKKGLDQALTHLIQRHKQHLTSLKRAPFFSSPYTWLAPWIQKLDDTKYKLDQSILHALSRYKLKFQSYKKETENLKPSIKILHYKQHLSVLEKGFKRIIVLQLEVHRKHLNQLNEKLHLINPKNLLSKGYSILFSEKDHSIINSVHTLKKDQVIRLVVADGEALSTIKEIFPHE